MAPKIILQSEKIIDKNCTPQDFLTILFKNRQFKKEELKEFLNPTHPKNFSAKDFGLSSVQLQKAIKRIKLAIKNKENILIYGDYDVDGITATAILWQTLNKVGAKVIPFIPDRENDGYGIKCQSFINFQKQKNLNFSLLITVDNGIVANKEIKKIKKLGVDIIITDHHVKSKKVPKVTAIIHSTSISGSAVSWFLASEFDSKADLGLAALGSVADCLPLTGINRNIVIHGLQSLQKSSNFGIKKLAQISGCQLSELSVYHLGFLLGPRINAVGRLSNPTDALRLLCSTTDLLASKYATNLDNFNRDRQLLQKESLDLAEKYYNNRESKLIFVSDQSFHPGVIGLIAGRLTEKYFLPSIAISVGENISKGSCRSIFGFNIIESLREISYLFVDLGGHEGAAGFSIETKNILKLEEEIIKIANKKLENYLPENKIIVDAQMEISAVHLQNHRLIKKLEPFGMGNTEPLFLFKNIKVVQKKVIGSDQNHLKLKLDDLNIDAIAFKKAELDSKIKIGDKINIVGHLDSNTWQGNTTCQLVIKEIFLDN